MIIDSHAHVYPAKIAAKASESIGGFYDIKMKYDGSVDALLRAGGEAGVEKFLIHSVATTPLQVESINNFIVRTVTEHPGRFIGFATLHPDFPEPEKELERAASLGLHGIKLHPDFQQFPIDDRRMWPAYAWCEAHGFPILFHTGDRRYEYSNPHLVLNLLEAFPDIKLICAHFGGYSEWDEAAKCLPGTNVCVDTSSSFFALTDERIMELIGLYGEGRIFFGTDYPMWEPKAELERFLSLPLSPEARDGILSGNLLRFLGLNK